MGTDVWIAAAIAVIQLIITIYGVVVSVTGKRRTIALVLTIVGSLGVALTVWAAVRNDRAQQNLASLLGTVATKKDVYEAISKLKPTEEVQVPSLIADSDKPITKKELQDLLKANTPQNPFAGYTIPQLMDELGTDAAGLNTAAREWAYDDNNQFLLMTEHVRINGTKEQQAEAYRRWDIHKKEIAAEWMKKSMNVITRSNNCRLAIMDRYPPTLQSTILLKQGNALFDKLLKPNADVSPKDLQIAAEHLGVLGKSFKGELVQ